MERRTPVKGIEDLWQKSKEKKINLEELNKWLTELENNVSSLNREYFQQIKAIEFVSNGNAKNIEEHNKKIEKHDKKIEEHNKKIEEHKKRIDKIEDTCVKIVDTIEFLKNVNKNLDKEFKKINKFLLPQMYPNEIDAFKSKPLMLTDKEVKKKMQNLQKFNRIIEEQKSRKSKRPQSKTLSRRRTIKKARNQNSRIMTIGGTRKKNNMSVMYNMGSCNADNEAMSNFARVPLSGGRRRKRRSRRRTPKRTQKKRRKRVKSRRRRTVRRRRRRR